MQTNIALDQNNQVIPPTEDDLKVVLESGKEWNYQFPEKNILSQEFKNKFYTELKNSKTGRANGKCIVAGGCVYLAHKKGIKKWINDIIQLPNQENNFTCIVKSTIEGYGWDPVNNKLCDVIFQEYGDANQVNCGPLVKSHYIRMAVTRACNRVAKRYVALDAVTYEELQEQEASISALPVTNELVKEYNTIIRSKNIPYPTVLSLIQWVLGNNNKTNFNSLSLVEASKVLGALIMYTPQQPQTQQGQTQYR